MALSCKVGFFNTVLDEIKQMSLISRTLNEPEPDISLLFGPFDILVQFSELRDIDEFVKKWLTPIRMITAEMPMVEKTQTWIVMSEGKTCTEKPFAFLFLNTQTRDLDKVQEELQAIPEVLSADAVFGPYDIISAIKASDQADLSRVISKIQREVPHIQGTLTLIVAPPAQTK